MGRCTPHQKPAAHARWPLATRAEAPIVRRVDSWFGRAFVIAIGGGYVLQVTALLIYAAREPSEQLTRTICWSFLIRAVFGALLLAAGLTRSMTLIWLALAVLVASLLVRVYEALLGPASLE
jgi:hypothetical protein